MTKTNTWLIFRGSCLAACLLTLSACATLNESECKTADWQTIGLEDGSRGLPVSTVGRHRKACSDYGVKPDLAAYRSGHADGVLSYCTPRNGFAQGKAGRSHHDVCPAELRVGFLSAYEDGRELYDLQREQNQVRRDIKSAEEDLNDTEHRLEHSEARVVADGVSSAEREKLLAEIKLDMARMQDLLVELDELESELQRVTSVYQTLSSQYRY